MSLKDKHLQMQKLVESGAIIPGHYSGDVGNITYTPMSIEEYIELIKDGNVQDIAYNTRAMGRGIFIIGGNGEIINFKGVDSKLKIEDSIAVASTEGDIEYVNAQDSFRIMITKFIDRKSSADSPTVRNEFRIKGASPLQDLFFEKHIRDFIEQNDRRRLVKLPQFGVPVPLNSQMCEEFDLPRVVDVDEAFLAKENPSSYAGSCISYMKENGIPFEQRNELWREYFQRSHREKLNDEGLMQVVDEEDLKYQLGATFGQATRVLESPFRIMELQYYMKQNNLEALNAILDFSAQNKEDFLSEYAETSAKNAAGFMNLKLAMDNFEHRQDFPLSGEICDDAFDDVSKSIYVFNPTDEDKFKILKYYTQVYLFATNVKVIEDAYVQTGRTVPNDLKKRFVETFYDSLADKAYFRKSFENPDPMSNLKHFENAEKNFRGMESFMKEIRQIAIELYQEKNPPKAESHNKVDEHDTVFSGRE